MRPFSPRLLALAALLAAILPAGCGSKPPEGNALEEPNSAAAVASPAENEFNGKLSNLMNDLSVRYRPLEYEYDEDLLKILDRVEDRLAGRSEKLDPLPMKALTEDEQLAHFKECIERWSRKTGKTLRAELDPLKAEVASRKPGGPAFHPEFHKRFSAAFDEFIPIEVAEIRERRNVALHEQASPLLDEYRGQVPDAVRSAEETLNAPPYNVSK